MFSTLPCLKPLTTPVHQKTKAFPHGANEKQLGVNRANAQLSSGPTSSEGKAKISHNARDEAAVLSEPKTQASTGFTGRTILLPSDDVAAYQAHVERLSQVFSQETDEEKRLAQALADTLWRLERIPSLEAGIYAIGRREMAARDEAATLSEPKTQAQFSDEADETVRRAMIEAQVLLTYRRDLTDLLLQESRLRRQYEKDETELQRLIAEREAAAEQCKKAEKACWKNAIRHDQTAEDYGISFDAAEIGFAFSSAEIARCIQQQDRQNTTNCGRYYEYKAG